MNAARRTLIASLIVAVAGSLWGLYWMPVRALSGAGWPGALGSVIVALIAGAILLPIVIWRRQDWRRADRLGVAATGLGGSAFMLYSVGIVEARVAVVILLFYLTPVWTTLLTRFVFGRAVHPVRYVVIVAGLAGLVLTLGRGGGLPIPQRPGEWYALLAGLFWSLGSIGMSARSDLAPVESTFVFVVGALGTAFVLFGLSPTWPSGTVWPPALSTTLWALAAGGLWWVTTMVALVWATSHLEPARVGILLMSEVLVGVISAALLAGESLAPIQIAGGTLLIGAAVLDVASDRLTVAR
ncbi:DMT family transporter [Salinisphaera sp. Q1T1-3]|uniref:DMT family transporter n=1 Tax=Salinisphaera sp. Q1T1-3 TaxID=2321229 RepID=UPI000E70F289|nr:DMT family transporter [Salinisphaera sp. Q1T1-3]RJS93092.1 DMT family transporter [Salinisphaera sp. Q1T1-3]